MLNRRIIVIKTTTGQWAFNVQSERTVKRVKRCTAPGKVRQVNAVRTVSPACHWPMPNQWRIFG